jgi:segregation and condensation protein A
MSDEAARVLRADDRGGAAEATEEVRFPVDLPAYSGGLERLVQLAQRGEIDLAEVQVSEITTAFRARLADEETAPDPREVADFLTLAARLVSLKAARLLPEGGLETAIDEEGNEAVDDPGARLAEYRLFKAAAEALLAEVAEEGVRSFLGMVSPEVLPSERLSISPERLAAAFRAVLERLPAEEPFTVDVGRYSVEEKVAELRALLISRGNVDFEEIFVQVQSRLEAVACFLALLEVIKSGDARVAQRDPFGAITVTALG